MAKWVRRALAFLSVLMVICSAMPAVVFANVAPEGSYTSYGIDAELSAVLAELAERSADETLAREAEAIYGSADWDLYPRQKRQIEELVSYTTAHVDYDEVAEPPRKTKIFEDIAESDISYWIDDRYYVFTYYGEWELHHTCTAGGELSVEIERPLVGTETLTLPLHMPYYLSVDGDDNPDIVVELYANATWVAPSLTERRGHGKGGLNIDIYRLNDRSPLELYFVKPFSYEGKTYIWLIGFMFAQLPGEFHFYANAENVVVTLPRDLWDFDFNDTEIVSVNPPYIVNWAMDEDTTEFDMMVGLAQSEASTTRYWIEAHFEPGLRSANLYYNEVGNTHTLTWRGDRSTAVDMLYSEEQLYAEAHISGLPKALDLTITEHDTYTDLAYEASSKIDELSFAQYDLKLRQKTYLNFSYLPLRFTLKGSFEIPPKSPLEPEPSDTIIGKLINRVVARITAALHRIKSALRTIPETLLADENFFELKIGDADHYIHKIEFGVVCDEHIVMDGNFIGFMGASINGAFEQLRELDLSSLTGLHLELVTRYGHPMRMLALGDNDRTLLNLSNLPSTLYLNVDEHDNVEYRGDTLIKGIELIHVNDNYMYTRFANISTSLKLTRRNGLVAINLSESDEAHPNELELLLTNATGDFYHTLRDEHLLFNSNDNYTLSLQLSRLRSLNGGGSDVGLRLREDMPLKLAFINESLAARLLLKDLPQVFNMGMAKDEPLLDIPTFGGLTLTRIPTFLALINEMNAQLLNTINNMTSSVKAIEQLSLSFESNKSNVLVCNITDYVQPPLPWTYGLNARFERNFVTNGKLYLTMPRSGSIAVAMSDKTIDFRLDLIGYEPDHEWLLINITGDRTARLYMNYLSASRFQARVHMEPELATNKLNADIDFACDAPIGRVYAQAEASDGMMLELLISNVPSTLALTVDIYTDVNVSYSASASVDFIWVKARRKNDISHQLNLFLRDLPWSIELTVRTGTGFELGTLSLTQLVPQVELRTDGRASVYLRVDGHVLDRLGAYELDVQDASSLSVYEKGGIHIKGRMKSFALELRDYPYMKDIRIDRLSVYGEDFRELFLNFHFIFGKLPIIELAADGTIAVHLKFRFTLFKGALKRSVTLVDVSFLSLSMRENSIELAEDERRTHYIAPAPVMSLWGD